MLVLPADLGEHQAGRLSGFIQSLAVVGSPDATPEGTSTNGQATVLA